MQVTSEKQDQARSSQREIRDPVDFIVCLFVCLPVCYARSMSFSYIHAAAQQQILNVCSTVDGEFWECRGKNQRVIDTRQTPSHHTRSSPPLHRLLLAVQPACMHACLPSNNHHTSTNRDSSQRNRSGEIADPQAGPLLRRGRGVGGEEAADLLVLGAGEDVGVAGLAAGQVHAGLLGVGRALAGEGGAGGALTQPAGDVGELEAGQPRVVAPGAGRQARRDHLRERARVQLVDLVLALVVLARLLRVRRQRRAPGQRAQAVRGPPLVRLREDGRAVDHRAAVVGAGRWGG